jgi:hypothetical protein
MSSAPSVAMPSKKSSRRVLASCVLAEVQGGEMVDPAACWEDVKVGAGMGGAFGMSQAVIVAAAAGPLAGAMTPLATGGAGALAAYEFSPSCQDADFDENDWSMTIDGYSAVPF